MELTERAYRGEATAASSSRLRKEEVVETGKRSDADGGWGVRPSGGRDGAAKPVVWPKVSTLGPAATGLDSIITFA